MIARSDLVILDTNVLLSATDSARKEHTQARSVFSESLRRGIHLAITGQIVREYLVVTTRPPSSNGLGLSVRDAIHNIDQFKRRTILLEESESATVKLINLVRRYDITGKQIHDANIVSLMIIHGVSTLLTMNRADFARFREINCMDLREFLE